MTWEDHIKIDDLTDLLLNLSGDLSIDDLQPDEIKLLEDKYGADWKKELEHVKNHFLMLKNQYES